MTWLTRWMRRHFYRLLERSPRLARVYLFQVWRRLHERAPHMDWRELVAADAEWWERTRGTASSGANVLLATVVGGHQVAAIVESALAVALTLRGARVHVLLCDTAMPACFQCTVAWYPRLDTFVRHGPSRDLCHLCHEPGERTFAALGLEIHRYSEYLTDADRARAAEIASALPRHTLATYRLEGLAVGEHALAGALRFYGCATIDDEPQAEAVLRRYVHAALLTVFALRRLLARHEFRAAVFHHGLYVPHGLIGEVCRAEQVPVVNWGATYRQQCFIFSHEDTYHHTMMTEPVETWERMPWTPAMEAQILDYLKSRWHGTRDWIRVHDDPDTDLPAINRELGIDPDKPCIGLLTNVMWDAQVCYPTNAFPTMREWVLATIGYFVERPDFQLLVRVHPAEAHRGPTQARQLILREIEAAFPTLPRNIILVPASSRVSTYALMSQCNAVLIYATKAGVELAATGMPVIVAGEAWVRNKGITYDVSSKEEYLALLDQLPLAAPLDEARTTRARKYAYHFFFRRMIPLDCVHRPPSGLTVNAASLEALLPGRDIGLDVVCAGILRQSPFVYPAECLDDSFVQARVPRAHDMV